MTASVFIQDRAPQSYAFLGISLAVTGFFMATGILHYGMQRHLAGIVEAARELEKDTFQGLTVHMNRLVVYLLLGGSILCVIIAVLTWAILARIDQGFAVFG